MRPVVTLALLALVLGRASATGRPLARPDRRLHDWLDDAKAGLDAAVSAIGDAITGAAQAAYASAEEKAEALMWAAFEKAVVAGPGLDPASARASAEALFNGEPIWGENCSPQYSSETWTDDLDYCCWQHDACWQREYDGGNTGVTVKGQIFYCDCDIELSRCADRVRAKCTGRPDEAGCAETHSEALAKAADLSFVFYTLPHIFSAINSVPGIDMGTCAEPAPRADEARPPPAVCVYCTADGERESFAINGGFDCSWQGGAAAPLRELPETACPSELRGMTLATELAGCPDPDAASECGASASGGGGTACVYCGAGGERKTYAINGPLDCAWQGETISLEQLPDASCPSEMDGRALAAQLNACPDPDTASECA